MTPNATLLDPPPEGMLCAYHTPSGKLVAVEALLLGQGQLCIGNWPSDGMWQDVYMYERLPLAGVAWLVWNADSGEEPAGWTRHTPTFRRRPGGDPALEYVQGDDE